MGFVLKYTEATGVVHKRAYAKIDQLTLSYPSVMDDSGQFFSMAMKIYASKELRDKALSQEMKLKPLALTTLIVQGKISELSGALEKGGKRPVADLRSVFYQWLSKRVPASDREIDFREAEAA